MPKAVSNASPLIHLAAIDRFHLLRDFFDQVFVPPAVWREIVEQGEGRPGAAEVQQAANEGWLHVVPLHSDALAVSLQRDLDEGEAEAIALAVEERPDCILLDESEGRRVAELHGLAKTGAIGLLIRAKRERKVDSLRDELDRLRIEAGFWIHEALYRAAIQAVGES